MPEDANGNGDIFGSWIMAKIDLGGCVLPAWGQGPCGHGGRQRIRVPLSHVGGRPAVDLRPRGKVGNTSVTVHVEAWAERNPSAPFLVKVTEAKVTYVAVDHEGRPRPIPEELNEQWSWFPFRPWRPRQPPCIPKAGLC